MHTSSQSLSYILDEEKAPRVTVPVFSANEKHAANTRVLSKPLIPLGYTLKHVEKLKQSGEFRFQDR